MTGLADAYDDDVGALLRPGRLQAGVALLGVGTFLALAALLASVANPTDLLTRRIAGVLGGLAAPALVGGVVVILPASPKLRAAAAIGASITLVGVASFWRAYPDHWAGYGRDLTAYVVGVYFLGMLTIVCCLFAGIATFKRRNDPGGTVSLQVGEGETKVVTVREQVSSGLGGVGLLGGTPDDTVETQTNRPDRGGSSSRSGRSAGASSRSASSTGSSSRGTASRGGSTRGASSTSGSSRSASSSSAPSASSPGGASRSTAARGAVSDGGAEAEQLTTPEPASDGRRQRSAEVADQYCGNCQHFRYVRTDDGMTPYCGLTSEYMEDMEACEDWSPNA